MEALPICTYFDAAGRATFVSVSDVIFTGTWSGATSYSAFSDVVNWGTGADQFIAIIDNLNQPPGSPYSNTTAWSPFVAINGTLPPFVPPVAQTVITIGTGIPGQQGAPGAEGPQGPPGVSGTFSTGTNTFLSYGTYYGSTPPFTPSSPIFLTFDATTLREWVWIIDAWY